MDNLRAHKYSKLMPEIPADEFEQVVADIRANGCHEDIWLYEGQILDGWHRYRACLKAEVAPKFREYKGKDPLSFVESMNLMRRHLDKSARTLVRRIIVHERCAKAPEGRRELGPLGLVETASKSAEDMSTSERTVRRADLVIEKAPELIEHVLKDEDDATRLPLRAAEEVARLLLRQKNPEKRRKIIEHQIRVRTAPKKPATSAKYVGPKRWEDVPAVREALDLMKSMRASAKKIEAVAGVGKFTPEAGRFVGKRLRDLASELIKIAANVERASK